MSARVGERQFAGAGGSAEFRDGVVLDIEVREAPDRHAAREWRRPAGIGIAGLDANIREERRVDRQLDNQLDRLTLRRMRDRNARKRNVLALHLRDLRHIADLLRRRSGARLALYDPVLVGRGGALRSFILRGRLRHGVLGWRRARCRGARRRLLGGSAAGNGHQQGGGEPPCGPFLHNLHRVVHAP